MKKKVGIIGGGIFGLSCAINLDKAHDVTVFDQAPDIMMGATYANHNRHHLGYHYPRSPETALQCLESREDFERTYGACCVNDFASYYCVSKDVFGKFYTLDDVIEEELAYRPRLTVNDDQPFRRIYLRQIKVDGRVYSGRPF